MSCVGDLTREKRDKGQLTSMRRQSSGTIVTIAGKETVWSNTFREPSPDFANKKLRPGLGTAARRYRRICVFAHIAMGSDHFPIKITLTAEKPAMRETRFVEWDRFKGAF